MTDEVKVPWYRSWGFWGLVLVLLGNPYLNFTYGPHWTPEVWLAWLVAGLIACVIGLIKQRRQKLLSITGVVLAIWWIFPYIIMALSY